MTQVYIGQIIFTNSLNDFVAYTNGFVAVQNHDGKIVGVGHNYKEWSIQNPQLSMKAKEIHLTSEQFLMPGLIDCHIHAPQCAQIGLGLDMDLLDWLNAYTFPLEAKFSDVAFASKIYAQVVKTTIRNGTTLASYFGTNHTRSNLILAQEVGKQGQRGLIGKVCSDCNSPDYYVENTQESLQGTHEFIHGVQQIKSNLVRPTITPRFALSCSKELLTQLGHIARDYDLHIQSHISESLSEIDFVKSIFATSYARAYDNAGLLTNKTIMAHAVHIEDDEITLFREKGTSVAHCPASNTMLSSGLCDVQRLLNAGIKVGLGTDVSGGNSISIMNAILRTLDVSHHLEFIKKQEIKGTGSITKSDDLYKPLNYKQAIYLATLGGAEALALDHITGNFAVGKEFDALLIDTSLPPLHNYGLYDPINYNRKSAEMKLFEMVQKFIYVGDDRNILRVFVAGKQIK